jgi:hypothetical protein
MGLPVVPLAAVAKWRLWKSGLRPLAETIMRQTRKPILTIFASIAGVVSGLHAACAQEASAPSEYQFFVTPYLWLASVHATTLTPLDRAPTLREIEYGTAREISDGKTLHRLKIVGGSDEPSR